jgi:hypothetical protein
MVDDKGSDLGSGEDTLFPSDKIVEIMEDVQPTGEPSTSPLDSLRLALPTPSVSSQAPVLQLDTAITLALPASSSNPASSSTSAPASALSSASSANAPSHSRSEAVSHRGRTSRRQQRSSGFPRSSKPPTRAQAGKQSWDQYFEGQEARGVSYEGSSTAGPSRASSSALSPQTSITDVGPARVLPQFRVVEVQAQPLLLHDTASNQLVETAVLSTDFSRSSILQRALQQQQQTSQQRSRSPSRERDRAPQRDRSRGPRREYRRRSPSPDYRRHSPPRSYRYRSPPFRERHHGSRRYSPPRESARGPPERRRQERRQERSRDAPDSARETWGATTTLYEAISLPGDPGYTAPTTSTERHDASGSTSRHD